jgi:hypothetical protein
MDGSPLAHELELARTAGTLEVVRLCRRRRHPAVRATVLPELSDDDVRARAQSRAEEEMAWWMDVDAGEGR